MTDDIAAIAAGLTKAQRKCILGIDGKLRTAREIGVSGNTCVSLMDFRRDFSTTENATAPPIQLVRRDYVDWPRLSWAYALAPLGEKVRQHLMEQSHGE